MSDAAAEPPAAPTTAEPEDALDPRLPRGIYLHVIIVAAIGGFLVLGWLAFYEWLNKVIWDNGFVTSHHWMFPVICLPFSLGVGLLVKYLKAPNNINGSVLDSLSGDTSKIEWRRLPVTVVMSLTSLFSGAVIGPEGGIGLISSEIAAWYNQVARIPDAQRHKTVFASVASAYNGLLENPIFTAVLGTELAQDRKAGLATLPANLIGGAVGYGVFLLIGGTGLADYLHLQPIQHFTLWDALIVVAMALLGLALAIVTAGFFQASAKFFGRFKERVILRALIAGVIFSVVGYFAPIVLFSGESQIHTVVADPAKYGVALLLVMALVKLALLAVAFKSGFLGGPTFPSIFASVCIALALSLLFPGVPLAIFLAGIMAGFLVPLFKAPFMVVLLTAFMLAASPTLTALIVLAVATVLIVQPNVQGRIAARRQKRAAAKPA